MHQSTHIHTTNKNDARTPVNVGVEGEGGEEVQVVQESGAGAEVVVGLMACFLGG